MRANSQPTSSSTRTAAINGNLYRGFFQSYGLRENPFRINPDPKYLHSTTQTQEALAQLTYGVSHRKGFMLLSGETGTGKTTVLNSLQEWLRSENIPTVFIFNPHLRMNHVLDFILTELGVAFNPAATDDARVTLIHWLVALKRRGSTAVVILDEAQGFSREMLEEIRLLLTFEVEGEPLLQVILAGQPELERKLRHPELRQLWQRITLRCRISPFTREQTVAYIASRLRTGGAQDDAVFSPGAVTAIHSYSMGIPRVMNLLCEHALINAYVENARPIPARIVDEIAREFELDSTHSGARTGETFETEEWFSAAALARAAGNRRITVQNAGESAQPAPQKFDNASSLTPTEAAPQVSIGMAAPSLSAVEHAPAPSTGVFGDPCEFSELHATRAERSESDLAESTPDPVDALDDLLPAIAVSKPSAESLHAATKDAFEPTLTPMLAANAEKEPEVSAVPPAGERASAIAQHFAHVARDRAARFASIAIAACGKAAISLRYAGQWVRYLTLIAWDAVSERAQIMARGSSILIARVKSASITDAARTRASNASFVSMGALRRLAIHIGGFAFTVAEGCSAGIQASRRWLRSPMGSQRPSSREQFASLKK